MTTHYEIRTKTETTRVDGMLPAWTAWDEHVKGGTAQRGDEFYRLDDGVAVKLALVPAFGDGKRRVMRLSTTGRRRGARKEAA